VSATLVPDDETGATPAETEAASDSGQIRSVMAALARRR
jgi:hypothetical protein